MPEKKLKIENKEKVEKLKKNINLELELTSVVTIFDIIAIADCPRSIGDSIDDILKRKVGEVVVGTYSLKNLKGPKNMINVTIKKVYDSEGRFLKEYIGKEVYLSDEELRTIGGWLGSPPAYGGEWIGLIKREEPRSTKQYLSE